MSVAQIPKGTVVPSVLLQKIDPRTVIPTGTILKENTVVSAPLKGEVDTRDPANKKGTEFIPPNSTIPDGVYLPKGTFIPQSVPVGTILPDRTILPRGAKVMDKTSAPYGSIVADGTVIYEKDVLSQWSQFTDYLSKFVGQRGVMKHIPLGTRIPLDTAFPVGSTIVPGTRIQKTGESMEISVPQGTQVLNSEALQALESKLIQKLKGDNLIIAPLLAAVRDNKGARLPQKPVIMNKLSTDSMDTLILLPGVVIPKFSNGDYAVLEGTVSIPLLANGSPSVIPADFVSETFTTKEENNIAKGTIVPKGCRIPPGTVIPPGSYIPPGTILYLPKRDDSAPNIVPPMTYLPVGTILSEKLGGTELNIPYGTYLPQGQVQGINITPDVVVPENFQLHPSGMVKNVRVEQGTYIPRTDMSINIPQGTSIPKEAPWVVVERENYLSALRHSLTDASTLTRMFSLIHVFLTVYALSVAFQEYANVLGIAAALLFPEAYLLIMYTRNPRAVVSDARLINLLIFMLVVTLLWSARLN